jgi:protein phosphatase
MSRTLVAYGFTHPGQKREDNQDAFGLFKDEGLFIVADGMGGHAAGEVAARIAVDEIERFFRARLAAPRDPWPFPIDKQESLGTNLMRIALKVANASIRQAAAADPTKHKMGATCAAMAISKSQVTTAHVGDVRAYRWRGGELARLTRDHSLVEEMRAARPEISDEELSKFAHRNVVTRALGSKEEVEPTIHQDTFEPGDIYLLCCDGLWDEVPDPRIKEILSTTADLELACQRLVDNANESGGKDNITALLIRVD